MAIDWWYVDYKRIKAVRPCSAGLRKFLGYMGGLKRVRGRFSVAHVMHNDPAHFEWLVDQGVFSFDQKLVLRAAYKSAQLRCPKKIVVHDEIGQSASYNARALSLVATTNDIVDYVDYLLFGSPITSVEGMNPQ